MNFPANADVLASLLRPFGVSATDSSDISDDSDTKNDDYKLLKTYLPQVYQPETASITPVSNETPAEKRRREGWQVGGWKKRTKLPYTTSMFYRDYHNINVQDVTHRDAKEFRLNYRMPHSEVAKLIHLFVARGWVKTSHKGTTHVTGHRYCPPEIKILGTLYWLGEGCSFRTIFNLSGRVYSAVSFRNFAQHFCKLTAKHLRRHYIRMPRNVADLQRISAAYTKLGLPGAVGSTDGVQIAWEGCPYAHRTSYCGKEKYPTLGFNVTVDHDLRVINICSVFAGRFNDKT